MNRTIVLVALATGLGCVQSPPGEASSRRMPSRADSFAGVQGMAGWQNFSSPDQVPACGNQAGDCGEGPTVDTTFTANQTVDGFTGVAAVFSGDNVNNESCSQCGSAPTQWGADALWELNLPNPPGVPITSFHWSSDFKVPAGQTYQALEWDAQQSLVGLGCSQAGVVNFGMQFDHGGSGHWRFFDYAAGHWVDTGFGPAADLADGAWHTISTNWSVSGTTVTLSNFTVDGTTYTPTAPNNTGSAGCRDYQNSVSVGIQLDNVPGFHYTAYYKNYDVSWSTGSSPPTCNTVPTVTEPFDGETDCGSAINLHVHADACVEAMNVYIDDALVQTINGSSSPIPDWIGGYSEGSWHRLVVVGYSTGSPDGASSTVNFLWP